jgi:hypothetical protein
MNDSSNQDMLISLKQCIDKHQGGTEVVLVLGSAESKQVIKLPAKMSTEEPAMAMLRGIVGATNIKLQ